jgi:hypothetical protein
MGKGYWKAMQMIAGAKKRLLKLYPDLPEKTGIYILTRTDEVGIKYAYIGQTKAKGGILKRMAEHLIGYQHIDRSLKAHKFKGEKGGEFGYSLTWFVCCDTQLDKYEQEYILKYANMGYQLRNKTAGGQRTGHTGLENQKAGKGYHDGLKQGRKNCIKEVKEYFDKYLEYRTKNTFECYKKPKRKNEQPTLKDIYVKKFYEFRDLLREADEDEQV